MNLLPRTFVFALFLLLPWCLQGGQHNLKQMGLTPEMIKAFNQLPPKQQKQLLEGEVLSGKKKGGKKTTEDSLEEAIPSVRSRRAENRRDEKEEALYSVMDLSENRGSREEVDFDEEEKREPSNPYTNDFLKAFGYDLFSGVPSTFAPVNDIPMPANYVVGAGDEINVQLYGKENEEYSLTVNREGELNFPEIGPIIVSGLKYEDMVSLLCEEVSKKMIGVKVKVSMGRLRSVSVFVLGEAFWPGSYTVSALSTMTNALFASGGIEKIGSLRKIQLKRQGKLVTQLDLYDLLLNGDTSGDARLQPGDVIFVPPVGPRVTIAGAIRRPAIYELNTETTLAEVLGLAGGLLPTAYLPLCRVERINNKGERTLLVLDLSKSDSLKTTIRDGDVIRLESTLEQFDSAITLKGHVKRPGDIQWSPGMHLRDVITSPDELIAKADLAYVLIRREISVDRRIELHSVDLGALFANKDAVDNIELQPRDQIIVFPLGDKETRAEVMDELIEELRIQATEGEAVRVVEIAGAVQAPGKYPLEKDMRVASLLRAAGSLQDAAYMHSAEITRYIPSQMDGLQVQHITVDLAKALAGNLAHNVLLQPYDRLHIKPLPEFSSRGTVNLAGEVQFPGVYTIRRGETLRELLSRAGGLTERAYPEGAIFLREELRKQEQTTLDRLAKQAEADLAAYALQEAGGSSSKNVGNMAAVLGPLLADLKKTEAVGRLVIDLPLILNGREEDVVLEDSDKIAIPPKPISVGVLGEVQFPTSHRYVKKWNRRDYVDSSGGLTYKADQQRIYVVRANGAVMPKRTFGCVNVLPGDTIVVPLKVDRISQITLWTAVTQIIYNLAVSTAAVKSIFH